MIKETAQDILDRHFKKFTMSYSWLKNRPFEKEAVESAMKEIAYLCYEAGQYNLNSKENVIKELFPEKV